MDFEHWVTILMGHKHCTSTETWIFKVSESKFGVSKRFRALDMCFRAECVDFEGWIVSNIGYEFRRCFKGFRVVFKQVMNCFKGIVEVSICRSRVF